jgi:hypothetical protein
VIRVVRRQHASLAPKIQNRTIYEECPNPRALTSIPGVERYLFDRASGNDYICRQSFVFGHDRSDRRDRRITKPRLSRPAGDHDRCHHFDADSWAWPMGAATDWTPLLPGHDIAIDDTEMLDVSFSSAFSLGFDFAEPSGGIDSTFSITLLNGVSPVGSFTFDAPDDVGAFVGVWSDASFNRAQIRETVGGSDDEFFGHFYTGTAPLPEPSIFALGIFGAITALGFSRRRKSDDNDA